MQRKEITICGFNISKYLALKGGDDKSGLNVCVTLISIFVQNIVSRYYFLKEKHCGFPQLQSLC